MEIKGYNPGGNWAPVNIPVYSITLLKPIHGYQEGDVIMVVDSQHPSFTNHWQILHRESIFIKKETHYTYFI